MSATLNISLLALLIFPFHAGAQAEIVGYLEPEKVVTISSELSAVVNNISAELGDRVEAGQQLATLEDTHYELQLQLAEARVALAQATARNNLKKYQRAKDLYSKKSVSITEFEDTQRDFEISNAQLAVDKANFDISQLNFSKTQIYSPFTAWVSSRMIETGQLLNPGSAAFVLMSLEKVKVVFFLLEEDIKNISIGKEIKVSIPAVNNGKISAHIIHLSPSQVIGQPGYRAEALLDNKEHLYKPGFTAKILLSENNDLTDGEI